MPIDSYETAKTSQPCILVADDDALVRKLLVRVFDGHDVQVLEAEDGQEAVDILRANKDHIHLLIADLVMPRLDGAGLVEYVNEIKPELPVLFVTGQSMRKIKDIELTETMHFLQKPFDVRELGNIATWMMNGCPVEALEQEQAV